MNIQAITLFVEDLAAARAFYENAFGLEVVFERWSTSCSFRKRAI